MARKRETVDTGPFVAELQLHGFFKKISDRVQVGIPDIVGCFRGEFIGIEAKSILEVPKNGWVPDRYSHTFDPVQVRNLKEIDDSGGKGLAVVICGKKFCHAFSNEISAEGQILWSPSRVIEKVKGKWPVREFLESII